MNSFFFRAIVIVQWGFLLYCAGEAALIIFAQILLGGYYPRGCFPIFYRESISTLLMYVAGFMSTFCLPRWRWALVPYALWVVFLLYLTVQAFMEFIPPFMFEEFLFIAFTTLAVVTLVIAVKNRKRMRPASVKN